MNPQRELAHHSAVPEAHESLGELLGDLMIQSGDLVKGEIALVKAELRQEARFYRPPTVIIGVGVAFGLLAAMALLAAGIVALSRSIGFVTSALIVGTGLAAVTTLLVTVGLRKFKRQTY